MRVLWYDDNYRMPVYCCQEFQNFSESSMVNFQRDGLYLEQKPDKVYRVIPRKGKSWGLGAFLSTLGLVLGLWIIWVMWSDSYYWAKDIWEILTETRLERPSSLLWLFQDLKIQYEPNLYDVLIVDSVLLVLGILIMKVVSFRKPKLQELVDKKNPGKSYLRWGLMRSCPFCGEKLECREGQGSIEADLAREPKEILVEAEEISEPKKAEGAYEDLLSKAEGLIS